MTAYSCSTTTHNMLAQVVDEYRDDGSKFSHAEDSCSTASHPRSCNDSPYKSYDSSISTRVVPSLCPSSSSDCNERTGELLHELELQHKGLFEDGAADVPPEWRGKTSVMIRNIAYNCFERMLREELRKQGFEYSFDYVYVPINAARASSKGYAFVNFLDASTAYKCKQQFDGRRAGIAQPSKALRVIPANLQGYFENVVHGVDKKIELSSTGELRMQSLFQSNDFGESDQSLAAPLEPGQSSNTCVAVAGELPQHDEPHKIDAKRMVHNDVDDVPIEWRGKTSVMIRNISYQCFEGKLRDMLRRAGFENLFDYVFVPINASRGTSKGYAFVNFLEASIAHEFKKQFDGHKMDISGGSKRLEVIPANLQGRFENASHYEGKQGRSDAADLPLQVHLSQATVSFNQSSRSTVCGQRSNSPMKVVLRSRPEQGQQLLCCHRCQNRVLSSSRFCQWCGANL
eukprot:TRINITY_DN10501_c0_g2_i1.p1 TRINITY_DN10501_c0_g2~~TRINITY_DN10501_c0_g2_i1.p1  ORF type:complete len:471 (-),score=67.42 TRINITY_DN10501_c0_g2_i1:695-2068(-)